jgi:hypothetical protein
VIGRIFLVEFLSHVSKTTSGKSGQNVKLSEPVFMGLKDGQDFLFPCQQNSFGEGGQNDGGHERDKGIAILA